MRFTQPELAEWLSPAGDEATNSPIITPGAFAAAAVRRQFADVQIARGLRSWPQRPIVSFNAWLTERWRDARAAGGGKLPFLLSPQQEHFLWRQAILESGAEVLDASATARAAMIAARFVADWEMSLDHPAWGNTEDTAQFHGWMHAVAARCRSAEWMIPTRLLPSFVEHLHRLSLPRRLVFAGFTDPPRALRHLITALRTSGVIVIEIPPAATRNALVSFACESQEQEFDLAARWVRARLEDDPNASLAILMKDLAGNRSAIERSLRDILQPSSVLQPLSDNALANAPAFQIHSSLPYRQQPVIAAALSILDFASPLVPAASVSAVLASPYLAGGIEERSARSTAEAALRRSRELELPLAAVERATAKCPKLSQLWPSLRAALRGMPAGSAEPAVWARFWRQFLTTAGWPGEIKLSPQESEAVQQWLDLLSTFDSLGFCGVRFSASDARSQLHSLVSDSAPQKIDLSLPIHVLDPAAAVPLQFDGAWLVGASELEWPPALSVPSFVPLALLRASQVPLSTPAGRREHARSLSNYIEACAGVVVASYTVGDPPGAKLSGLFRAHQQIDRAGLHLWEGKVLLSQIGGEPLETIDDSNGPALRDGAIVVGGASILKSQSACPFQAFVKWRLRGETLEDGEFSYDFRQRGQFLHAALNAVWREIETSERLRSLGPKELEDIASRAATKALSADRAETDFRVQLRGAEHYRLVSLILEWLEVEKRRSSPFKVLETETPRDFTLSRLLLHLRADRVDELETGGLVIIDYKSGKKKRTDLDTERPIEPQLLAYAAMLESQNDANQRVAGLYFATVRRDNCGAEGYGREPHFGQKGDAGIWGVRVREWRNTIETLASEFENGVAVRATNSKPCAYCEVKPICRIQETAREGRSDEG